MEQTSILELIAIGVIALFVLMFYGPGLKHTIEQSKNAPKDWMGVFIPLLLVTIFVGLMLLLG